MKAAIQKICILILSALCITSFARHPRETLEDAFKALQGGELQAAAEYFDRAASDAPHYDLDPSVPLYNQALALLLNSEDKPEHVDAARALLERAERTTDKELQSKVFYTQGLADFMKARPSVKQGQFDQALKALENALESFAKNILLDPNDEAAKKAFETTDIFKRQIEKMQQQQQQSPENQQEEQDKQDQKEDQEQQQQGQQEEGEQESQPEQNDEMEQETDEPSEQQPSDSEEDGEQPSQAGESGEDEDAEAREMNERQAEAMLDAMREEEQARRAQLRLNLGRPVPVEKDW